MGMTADQLSLARLYLDDKGSSAVQTIQIDNAVGGSFTITYSGQTTTAIAWNAGANVVQNALTSLPNIGVGNLEVAPAPGVPGSVFFPIYFIGTLGLLAQPMLTVNISGLTGTGVLATVTQVAAGGVLTFSDDELNLFYSNASLNFFLAIAYAFRALQAPSAKFNDYTAGQTQDKKSQINKQIIALADHYQQWAFADQQVQFVKLNQVPPRVRAVPRVTGIPATGLTVTPFPPNYPWRRNGWGNW